ncbi:complex I subunit 5 family protein [Haloglomus litoreum]|uniref:complex I subunit 5 family protein n=1 Tax=Haloglomus litoreum TaxID=3034026 RepID=UPI0023E87E89|nr:proton-conducting transporter membrane subunit [Haloglomus sp. DT116]
MSAPQVVVAPLLAALLTAILALLTRWGPRLQRGVSVAGAVAYLVGVAALFRAVQLDPDNRLVYQVSNWDAPFGITLVADPLSVLLLALAAVVSLVAAVYGVRSIDREGQRLSYHALYHLMVVGVTGAFLTGDIFNLFVWFEVMLMSSYVLVAFHSDADATRAALQYAVLNLLGSAVMLLAIGGLYATTGTLNMADMARRLAEPAAYGIDPAPVLGLSAVLLVVFLLKAGVVPFQFWVPDAYRAAPAPTTAMLAGVVKKVGVYAVLRLYFTVFAAAPLAVSLPGIEGGPELGFLAFFGPVLFLMATASTFLGGLGAIDQPDMEGLLAYSSIGQIGFIVLPLAVAATATDPAVRTLGIAAALVYSVNHGLAKALLFLAVGAVEDAVGSTRLSDLGGLTEATPVLSGAFLIGALSLVGIPPLTGFFAKLLVFDTAVRAGAPLALVVALAGAVLTIAYVTRAWNRAFWGEPGPRVRAAAVAALAGVDGTHDGAAVADGGHAEGDEDGDAPSSHEGAHDDAHGSPGDDVSAAASIADPVLVACTLALAVLLVALGVGFDPLYTAATDAANAALDTGAYVDAVDPTTAGEALADGGGSDGTHDIAERLREFRGDGR